MIPLGVPSIDGCSYHRLLFSIRRGSVVSRRYMQIADALIRKRGLPGPAGRFETGTMKRWPESSSGRWTFYEAPASLDCRGPRNRSD